MRLGVCGSLSPTSSASASVVKIPTAYVVPIQESELGTGSQPKCTDHAITAAGVSERSERWGGVVIPLVGAVGLVAILALSIAQADVGTRWFELGGLALGVPFALWRGAHGSAAGPVTEG